jgi:alcohol dehydrogenase
VKAVYFEEHGDADVLRYGEFPDPEPGPEEVRLRVLACSLNYLDVFSRRGLPGIAIELPSITGGDCVGRVDAIGSEVTGVTEGDRVLVDPSYLDLKRGALRMLGENCRGALAELCVVHHTQLIPLPDSVSDESAACLPVAYGTSHRMVITRGQVRAGETVLILGASGGVGTSSLAIAKLQGAHVIAAAGSDEKCERLRALGADETINYAKTDFREYCRERTGSLLRGGGYDVVINFTGGDTWAPSLRCAKLGGRVLTCGATAGYDPQTDLRYVWTGELNVLGSNGWRRSDLEALVTLVESGRLEPAIDCVLPLDRGIEACRLLEDRAFFGKIVVTPPPSAGSFGAARDP